MSTPLNFNRAVAAGYAMKYAKSYNTTFANFSGAAGGGGDCTNFVSQAMLAGGWPMLYGMAHDATAWWSQQDGPRTHSWWEDHVSSYASYSWASAKPFYQFLKMTSRAERCAVSDLQVGDIVQMRFIPGDITDHTMIVTMKWYDDVNVTYHTTDTLNRSLKEIRKGRDDYEFICWKVADSFLDTPSLSTTWKVNRRI